MAEGLNHEPLQVHAADDVERLGTPADVCGTCSDIPAGVLVPASFCPEAKTRLVEVLYPWER